MYDEDVSSDNGSSIYEAWNVDVDDRLDIDEDVGHNPGDATPDDPWDFGTNVQYPALKLDFDGDTEVQLGLRIR